MTASKHRWEWGFLLVAAVCAGGAAGAEFAAPGPSEFTSLSLEQLPDGARRVIEQPSLMAAGPVETFRGSPALYHWFLDHPDQAMKAWRRLGAKGREITDLGNGRFRWNDGAGTTVCWETVYRDIQKRVWYAEGTSQPTRLLPMVPLRAVVVMYHGTTRDGEPPLLQHRADLYLQTDSRTAQVVTRMLGPSAPRMAEQGLAQLELFFSALIRFLDRYPEHAITLRRD